MEGGEVHDICQVVGNGLQVHPPDVAALHFHQVGEQELPKLWELPQKGTVRFSVKTTSPQDVLAPSELPSTPSACPPCCHIPHRPCSPEMSSTCPGRGCKASHQDHGHEVLCSGPRDRLGVETPSQKQDFLPAPPDAADRQPADGLQSGTDPLGSSPPSWLRCRQRIRRHVRL